MKRIYNDDATEEDMIKAGIEHFKATGYIEASSYRFLVDGDNVPMTCDKGCCKRVYDSIESALEDCGWLPDEMQE